MRIPVWTSRLMSRISLAVVAAALLPVSAAHAGTTHDVDVGPFFSFSPANLTIEVGDTVLWTWVGGDHNVVSGENGIADGNFSSGEPTDVKGTTFEVTFDQDFLDNNPMPDNAYPYFCEVHVGFGMTGTVTVEVPEPCPADITGDSQVNVSDLLDLLSAWGPCDGCAEDITGDDQVNVSDLLELLSSWGPCP